MAYKMKAAYAAKKIALANPQMVLSAEFVNNPKNWPYITANAKSFSAYVCKQNGGDIAEVDKIEVPEGVTEIQQTPSAPENGEGYEGKKVNELTALLNEREVEIPNGTKKAGLIELLIESDKEAAD